jgi:hypothetical protein
VWWSSQVDDDDCMSIVIGPAEKLQLVRIDRDGLRMECRPLVCEPPASVCGHNGVLFMVSRRQISIVSMESGATLQSVQAPRGLNWRMQRFFQRVSGLWYALSYDGHAARFDTVQPADGSHMPRLIALFDQEGVDGPVGVTAGGAIYNTVHGVEQHVQHGLQGDLRVPWVAPDGHRFQLAQVMPLNHRYPSVMVDVEHKIVRVCSPPCFDDRVQSAVHTATIRHRLSAVGVTDYGELALRSARGQVVEFAVRHGLPLFTPAPPGRILRHVRQFEPMECDEIGYRLSSARWDDGSECVLDSRGLLHLRPANPAIPETTLVLSEGELSGWSSDGRAWGRMYFVSAGPQVLASTHAQAGQFDATVRQFVACIDA